MYQPAVYFDTPGQPTGGPTMSVGASNAPASPASPIPAVPTLRPPAVDANAAAAAARYAAGMVQSSQPIDVQVVQLPAAQVSMAVEPQVPLGSARPADLQLNTNVGGSVPKVLRPPTTQSGAASDIVVSAGYFEALRAQLHAAQEEIGYLRHQLDSQLQPPDYGHPSPTDGPDEFLEEDSAPVLVIDKAPLKDADCKRLSMKVKAVFKTLVLKPEDSVSVIHSKITKALVRLGGVEGGSQYRAVAAEAFQLVPDPKDQNPLPLN